MENPKETLSRFELDGHTAPRLVRNEELICWNCRFRSGKSGICVKYPQGEPGSTEAQK